jgi:hypothetical protein
MRYSPWYETLDVVRPLTATNNLKGDWRKELPRKGGLNGMYYSPWSIVLNIVLLNFLNMVVRLRPVHPFCTIRKYC